MFGQGSYGSELRQGPPAPHQPPPYQQAPSLPAAPMYQQGPAFAHRPFFHQGSVPPPPPPFQTSPSIAQPPFRQSLPIPPPPPRLPPPPPPPALGVQPGQPQQIPLPYQPQTVPQPSAGNSARPYLPTPPPPPPLPPSTHGNSTLVSVNLPQAPGGPPNPLLANQNMIQNPSYQHPSHGVRPMSLQPTPGFQHFPMPPQPTLSASFTSFVQGTASDCQPPCSPPPPPPPLPSSPPPLPSSPPPDEELLEADTFVGSMSKAGNVDAALPTAGDTFCGEAGHSSEVLATSLQEETSTLLTPIEDIIQNERPPILNEQHLQSNTDRSEKQDDSDMDMEDDDFSEPDIEHKSSEFDNRIQESDIRDKRLKESDDLPASSKEMSQYQHNQLLTTIGANELDIEVKASESKTSTVINPMEIHSVVKENKSEFVGRLLFKNGSPLRQIQDYASDDDTEDDENSTTDARTTVEEAAVTPVLNDDASQVHWSGAQVDIDSKIDLHAENATTTETLLVSAETIASDTHPVKSFNKNSTITVDNNSLRDVAEMNHRKDDNVSDTEARTVDATTTLPEHDNLENAVEASPQVATSLSEDKKLESVVHKVDEFGRMIRADASESDSESEDMRYNERYAKRGNTRPSVEVRGRRSRSPWHRRDKRSRSPSWSPRAERSRSRSPASSRRAGELARHGRAHPPQCFNFLRGRCRYGSSCHYSHSDVIQDRTKLHHRWGHSGISVKQETQKVMEKSSEETGTGQGHSSSPDMHMHDLQVSKDNSVDEKQIVHNTDGDDIGGLPHLVAPSPGSMEVVNSTFHEIVAAEAQEEQGKQHSVEESGQKSVEQQPSPLGGSPDQVTLSAREDLSNHLDDHIILQHSEGTSAPERLLPLPDEKSDAPTFPQIGPVYSNRSETTESLPLNFPGNAITPIPSDPSGTSGQQFEPQINFLPSVAAPPAPMLPSSASMSSFPPPHNPSLPNEFHFADAAPRPSWTELQPTIPTTGTHPFQFAPNAVPPRNEFHVPSNIRPMPLGLDGVPTVQNYELNQSSHLSVPAHQFLHRPAGTYHVGPIDARHRENHAPFQQNAPGLPSFSNVNMMQGQHNFPPANNFQRNSLIFPNESGTSRFSGGDFHPLSNSGSHPQQLMHGLHAPAGSVPSIHGPPRPLEPPFSSQSAGFSEHKQELLHGVVMPKIASTTYYNPFASTFDQTYREPRYSASFIPNRDSFNDRGQWAASSSGSRSGMFFSSLPGTTASASYEGISLHGHSQGQSTAPTSAALRHSSDVIYGKQYDPLSDSFDSLGTVLRKLDASQEKSGPVGTSVDLDNNILKKSGELIENNQRKVVAKPVSNLDDEVGETATDTEAGAVENGSPLLDEGKDWNPEIPVATTAEDVEIDQQPSPGKTKKGKDSRSMKLFKIAIANFVKEILKPSWRQGNMSKEAFKTIVKKTVDKVAGVMPNHQVPKSQAKIEQYVESSQRKLTKLVMGYVEKYVKT